jgi:hypothetical protein
MNIVDRLKEIIMIIYSMNCQRKIISEIFDVYFTIIKKNSGKNITYSVFWEVAELSEGSYTANIGSFTIEIFVLYVAVSGVAPMEATGVSLHVD